MREFIRHPADVPIVVTPLSDSGASVAELEDISEGGLRCNVPGYIKPGLLVSVEIPGLESPYQGQGTVVWCQSGSDGYEVGIRFTEDGEGFRLRMVEQVCQIEHYRQYIAEKEGRELTSEEAASEWIRKHAANFDDESDD